MKICVVCDGGEGGVSRPYYSFTFVTIVYVNILYYLKRVNPNDFIRNFNNLLFVYGGCNRGWEVGG